MSLRAVVCLAVEIRDGSAVPYSIWKSHDTNDLEIHQIGQLT